MAAGHTATRGASVTMPAPSRDTTDALPAMRAARHASVLLASAAMLALAACSDSEDSASVVAPAQAQTTAPDAAPAPDATSAASTNAERQTDPSAATPPTSQGSVDVAELMAPGALPDVVIGDANAPVTIIEYASLTCPHCAAFHKDAWPAIKADYVDTGVAKMIIRETPFDQRALAGFMLARCVPADRRTSMVDVLFDQQATWAQAENASTALLSIARLAGMSETDFRACLENRELQGQIVQVLEKAQADFGVNATPTFFVNGERYAGAMSADQMAALIEAAR